MSGGSAEFPGDRLDAIIIGYVLWIVVLFVVFDIASNLQIESQIGTLEQVFLSPFGAIALAIPVACSGRWYYGSQQLPYSLRKHW